MIKKEYAELNRPSELIIDKAEYIKILKEADHLLLTNYDKLSKLSLLSNYDNLPKLSLFLLKKALGKDV